MSQTTPSHRPVSVATAAALELPSLLALVAARAATDLGRERLLALEPFEDAEALTEHRQRHEEAERLISVRPLVPSFERPLAPLFDELARGGRELEGRDLVILGDILRANAETVERIREVEPACEALGERVAEVPLLEELRRAIAKTFDRRGQIREDASPRLVELRGRIRGARNHLYTELRSHLERNSEHLSEETIPLRGGRLVLMLQAGSRGKIPGLVHGRSGSGRSFYFEPLDVVEHNNDLQHAIEEEEEEKRRLLIELIERVRGELDAVEDHAELLCDLDLLQGSIRFAQAAGARLAELGGRHQFRLREARHPLLDPRLAELRQEALGQPGHQGGIVPLELELDAEKRILVVTGPNAGGKTVALKTAGLLALAHQCGLPIPVAKGSRLPFMGALVATVGDDQDLFTDRSTFSGRLMRLDEAWKSSGPDSLILLDELGSGTDPEEGSALAVALLEALLASRSLVVITTHLTQLASAALEADGAVCAAMEFDAATGEPTYSLMPGPPGGSEALALARRLGLAKPWLDRAEALLGSEHRDLRSLIAEVDRVRKELVEREERLATEVADAKILRERLAKQEAALAEERRRVGEVLEEELREFQDGVRRKLREEVDRLRQEIEAGRRQGLAARAEERLFEDAPEILPEEARDDEVEIEEGGRVRHRSFGWEGVVEKLDRGRAHVRAEGKLFRCRENELMGITDAATQAERKPSPSKPRRGWGKKATSEPLLASAPRELKLIGQRVEPALKELDRFLDQALLASHAEVRIVHGHGSGKLRQAVREHLRGHPAVERHEKARPEEGGNGATKVEMRV